MEAMNTALVTDTKYIGKYVALKSFIDNTIVDPVKTLFVSQIKLGKKVKTKRFLSLFQVTKVYRFIKNFPFLSLPSKDIGCNHYLLQSPILEASESSHRSFYIVRRNRFATHRVIARRHDEAILVERAT